MQKSTRPAWVEIDLKQLRRNFEIINQDKPANLAMTEAGIFPGAGVGAPLGSGLLEPGLAEGGGGGIRRRRLEHFQAHWIAPGAFDREPLRQPDPVEDRHGAEFEADAVAPIDIAQDQIPLFCNPKPITSFPVMALGVENLISSFVP